MDLYHTTDTNGVSELNPSTEKMRELLNGLDDIDADDPEHPDVSLVHDPSGWSISVFPSRITTLENLDDADEPPRYMNNLERTKALELWVDLSKGRIDHILSLPWINQ